MSLDGDDVDADDSSSFCSSSTVDDEEGDDDDDNDGDDSLEDALVTVTIGGLVSLSPLLGVEEKNLCCFRRCESHLSKNWILIVGFGATVEISLPMSPL